MAYKTPDQTNNWLAENLYWSPPVSWVKEQPFIEQQSYIETKLTEHMELFSSVRTKWYKIE